MGIPAGCLGTWAGKQGWEVLKTFPDLPKKVRLGILGIPAGCLGIWAGKQGWEVLKTFLDMPEEGTYRNLRDSSRVPGESGQASRAGRCPRRS